jgi:hypothetical protein
MSINKTTHIQTLQGRNETPCMGMNDEQAQNHQDQKHLGPLLRRRHRRFFCSSVRAGGHCRIGQKKQLTL